MAHYGIGELTAVTILAELGDCRRFSSSRDAVRYAGLGHHRPPVRSAPRPRASLAARGRPRCAGRCSRPPRSPRAPGSPDRDYYRQAAERLGAQPRLPGGRAQAAQAQLPHAARARRGGAATRLNPGMRAQPSLTPMHRGRLPACSCRHRRVDGPERPSGRNASLRDHPINHHVAGPEPPRAADRDKAGRPRAPRPAPPTARTHPQTTNDLDHINPDAALADASLHR